MALLGDFVFGRLPIEQGGWQTRLRIAASGKILTGADTYNGSRLRPGAARCEDIIQIGINCDLTEISTDTVQNIGGAYDVAVCYGDDTAEGIIIYGKTLVSYDDGDSFKCITGFPTVTADPNGQGRQASLNFLEFDPANKAVLGHGSEAGLYYTLNGSAATPTVVQHPDIPAPLGTLFKHVAIYFDRSSSLTGGKTSRVLVYSSGNGWYLSTTGIDGSFAHITGSPDWCTSAEVHPDNGALFVAGRQSDATENGQGEGSGQLRRYLSGSWTAPGSATDVKPIVCVPGTSGNRVYVGGSGGGLQASYNAASTCTFTSRSGQTQTRYAPRQPWLAWTNEVYMSNGRYGWDPLTGTVICGEGIGVWALRDPPTSGGPSNLDWDNIGDGIYQLVGAGVTVRPDGVSQFAFHDRPAFFLTRDGWRNPPITHAPTNVDSLSQANNIDYAKDDPEHVMFSCGFTGLWRMAYTSNVFGSWTRMTNVPAPMVSPPDYTWGGETVIGNAGVGLHVSIAQYGLFYNNDYMNPASEWDVPDMGSSAANAFLAANLNTDDLGLHGGYFLARQIVWCDTVTKRFYIYWPADGVDPDVVGLYKSVNPNDASSFTRIRAGLIGQYVHDVWNSKLQEVLGHPGNYWWTGGTVGNAGQAHASNPLFFTKDIDNEPFVAVGGDAPTEVQAIGFGANRPGALYKIIFVYVEDEGWKRCEDFDPDNPDDGTWISMGRAPGGIVDFVRGVAGDPDLFGRVYGVQSGCGAVMWRYTKILRGV